MKPYSLHIGVAIGMLVWACCRGVGQPLILSAPIIIQAAGVDRGHVMNPHGKVVLGKQDIVLDGEVGVVLKDTQRSEVEALVRYGLLSHCPVCLVDGSKLIALCHVAGEASVTGGGYMADKMSAIGDLGFCQMPAPVEYGFMLRLGSAQEADKVALLLKREPPNSKPELEELIRYYKHNLDDQRFWRAQRPNTLGRHDLPPMTPYTASNRIDI